MDEVFRVFEKLSAQLLFILFLFCLPAQVRTRTDPHLLSGAVPAEAGRPTQRKEEAVVSEPARMNEKKWYCLTLKNRRS